MTVDATALTGSNTFTWNGTAETNGSFIINGGSSVATITGGSKNDSIYAGTGTTTIDGGPGVDTIELGVHTSGDSIMLKDFFTGADIITDFVGTGTHHDTIYVAIGKGLYFVESDGGNVWSNASCVGLMKTIPGAFTYGGHVNMIFLADDTYPNSSSVVTALQTAGTDQMTLENTVGASAEVLVV